MRILTNCRSSDKHLNTIEGSMENTPRFESYMHKHFSSICIALLHYIKIFQMNTKGLVQNTFRNEGFFFHLRVS